MTNKKTYLEQVREDVEAYYDENKEQFEGLDKDETREKLEEDCWNADSVTGNPSGSYTFSKATAKEFVLAEPDTLREAFLDFDESKERIADLFLDEEWETMDIICRCYVLSQAVSQFVDTLFKE